MLIDSAWSIEIFAEIFDHGVGLEIFSIDSLY